MKKIIALILAIMMIASMSVVVFAEDKVLADTDGDNNIVDDSDIVDVTYDVRKGYEVTIPGDFNLTVNENDDGTTHGTGEGVVTINMAKLEGGEVLTVTAKGNGYVTGTSTEDLVSGCNWVLIDERGSAANVGYKIAVSGSETSNDLVQETGVIVEHDSDNDDPIVKGTGRSSTLTITTNKTSQAGLFMDHITFLAAVN